MCLEKHRCRRVTFVHCISPPKSFKKLLLEGLLQGEVDVLISNRGRFSIFNKGGGGCCGHTFNHTHMLTSLTTTILRSHS